ncbi:MAG TPA: hypothetical protein VIX59_19585 [Candidatus Binataceae bacterium]
MKVIKRSLFVLAILVFGVGLVRSALAVTPPAADSDEMPVNGTYSFSAYGGNVVTVVQVPAESMSGVFTVATGTVTGTFNVTGGSFTLKDNKDICTGTFSGKGTPVANTINSGTMALTLASLVGTGCAALGVNGSPLTLYYGVASISSRGNPDLSPTHSVIFFEDIDTNTLAITGEAQLQGSVD